jgi:L-arabonate dehydrase
MIESLGLSLPGNAAIPAADSRRKVLAHVSEEELQQRKKNWKPVHKKYDRGYVSLYQRHVQQAHLGADLDYLNGGSGSVVTRDSH